MAEPRAFVSGWPISHSRSPIIHRHWLKRMQLAGSYEPIAVPPEQAKDFFTGLAASGYAGGNVTLPNKEAAYAACARRDAAADAIGAVNTLWFEKGILTGGNTDSHGFAANLDERAPGWADADRAIVLGAGGAARAVVHALVSRRIPEVLILNRTFARAEDIAGHFGPSAHARPWQDAETLFSSADLVVNTTSLGMHGNGGEGRLPSLDAIKASAIVTDIVYVPLMTPFLLAAQARGLKTADGLGMLLHQAAPGFEHWFGVRPAVTDELRELVIADMEAGH